MYFTINSTIYNKIYIYIMEQYNTDAVTSYRKLLKYYRMYEKYMNLFDENNPTTDNSLQAFGKIQQIKAKMQAEYENIKNGAGVDSELYISNFINVLLKKRIITENKNTMKKQLNERIEPKHLEFLEEFIAGSYMDIAAGRKTFNDAFNDFLNFVKVPFTPAELKKLQAKGRKILLQTEKEHDELFDEIGGFDSVDYRQNYYENKNMSKKNTIRLTESDLKRVISKSVKSVLKEGFNSPLPSFAAKEVEPKHRLRKQWDDDYDAMVARNHARGGEFMDDFNKKANLSYGKSLKENQENLPWSNSDVQNNLIEIKRIVSYLVNDYLDNVSQEQLDELGDMTKKYRQFLSTFMKQIDSKRW